MARPRSSNRQFLSLLDTSSSAVYALDDRRRIIYCNQACALWLGLEVQQLVGRQCDYHSGDLPTDELAAAICPPPEVFAGSPAIADVIWRSAEGRTLHRQTSFCPLVGSGSDTLTVVAIVSGADRELDDRREVATTAEDYHNQLRMLVQTVRRHYRVDRLVGDSPAIERVRDQVRLASQSAARVLVVGPPGCGREYVARSIHCGPQPDAAGPLLPLSAAELDAELLQTTILAFLRRCREADLLASSAILLLDVDQLSPAGQVELLGFLRLPTFELRALVTARRPLLELAETGTFDRSLALALSTLVIQLPALQSRRQDIPAVAQQFVELFNASGDKQLSGFAVEALDLLAALPWNQDVDELAAIVGEACREAPGPWITEADLPKRVKLLQSAAEHPVYEDPILPLDDFLTDIERELIQRALDRTKGNKAQAARLLDIQRARLLRRITQLGIESSQE